MRGVHNVGDVMCDALLAMMPNEDESKLLLERYHIGYRDYLLATVHRANNTDDLAQLADLIRAFEQTGENVVFPVHPRTRKALDELDIVASAKVRLIEPVGYREMIVLERCAKMILTDSGGVQKEAYMLGVPCVTLREETEWVETVSAGWNTLTGSDPEQIVRAVRCFVPKEERPPLFGDGKASSRIAQILESGC